MVGILRGERLVSYVVDGTDTEWRDSLRPSDAPSYGRFSGRCASLLGASRTIDLFRHEWFRLNGGAENVEGALLIDVAH